MVHYNITISGNVQGVFFRKYTVAAAIKLGIKGFVQNQPNGDVYCEAEGEADLVKQFMDWCHKGSPLSKVTGVVATKGTFKNYESFQITR
jgi:acylphosphatase